MENKRAAAIKYVKGEDRAPRLVAKGRRHLAEKIIEAARANNIPIHENDVLSQALDAIELNKEIPTHLYRAVAEVLAWVYAMEQKAGS